MMVCMHADVENSTTFGIPGVKAPRGTATRTVDCAQQLATRVTARGLPRHFRERRFRKCRRQPARVGSGSVEKHNIISGGGSWWFHSAAAAAAAVCLVLLLQSPQKQAQA